MDSYIDSLTGNSSVLILPLHENIARALIMIRGAKKYFTFTFFVFEFLYFSWISQEGTKDNYLSGNV